MKQHILTLAAGLIFLLQGLSLEAQSDYKKFVKDVVDSTSGPNINLYRNKKGKIFLSWPEGYLGRRLMAGGTISSVSDPSLNVGMKYSYPMIFSVESKDSMVVLTIPNYVGASSDPELQKASERNFLPTVHRRIPISARKDGKIIFEISSIVTGAAPKGKEFKSGLGAEEKTAWFGKMKAFEDNVSLTLYQNTEIPTSVGTKTQGSMSSTVSLLVLPEVPMKPRLQDVRIGVFSTGGPGGTGRLDINASPDGVRQYRFANRWRIEPVDIAAWQAGKKVGVKKNIVWYVDDSFPESWKQPIKDGILAWNAAFEKIGLKNVMEVRPFPTEQEDPAFDPDNLKYNCIRFIPNTKMNAMGPSWVDPLTGEILNASVLIYNDVARLLTEWRFIQTAQVDKRVRSGRLPERLLHESLVYVVSHEVGHTLGLMHNMAASSAFDTEKLRDPSFTAMYGLSPSIMDYARFNYVAQPGDKGVRLIPPSLGVYDEYVIEWLYKPVPKARDMWEEAAIAGKIIDAHAGDPFYRFSSQQSSTAASTEYDPSARKEDLGSDPVKSGRYGMSNLRYILSNMNGWVEDDDDYSRRTAFYGRISKQFQRYMEYALAQVGGVYLFNTRGSEAVRPVPAAVQKEALAWVVEELKSSAWLDDRSVTAYMQLAAPASNRLVASIASKLSSVVPSRVSLCSFNSDEPYSVKEYFDDLFDAVFATSISGGVLNSQEKTLQRELVSAMSKPIAAMQGGKASFSDDDQCCFGEGIPIYQRTVDSKDIDESPAYRIQFVRKVKELSAKLADSAPDADKAHYDMLETMITL
ncbi:MAG: zinc-dependent metalloprotease [Bacteroidales bacterium]|nr:zinc-dependent metalloprotease [Bacteroidales bacterium]